MKLQECFAPKESILGIETKAANIYYIIFGDS